MNSFEDGYLFFRTWRTLRPFDEAQDMLGGSNIRIREFWLAKNLREPRKFAAIVVQGSHRKKIRIRSVNRKERKVRKEEVGATGWSPSFAARRKKICKIG